MSSTKSELLWIIVSHVRRVAFNLLGNELVYHKCNRAILWSGPSDIYLEHTHFIQRFNPVKFRVLEILNLN